MFKNLPLNNLLLGALSTLLIVMVHIDPLYAQGCDQCPKRVVSIYDCDVQVPVSSFNSISSWWDLSWPQAYANHTLFNNHSSENDCMAPVNDYSGIEISDLETENCQHTPDWLDLPPSGAIQDADYVFVSTVTGSNGNYTYTLSLQTAITREIVKSASASFTDASSGIQAGNGTMTTFLPIYTTILNYEQDKRAKDVTVARGQMAIPTPWMHEMTDQDNSTIYMKPDKAKVDTAETIHVHLTMDDCDGYPLANRQIYFTDPKDGTNLCTLMDGKLDCGSVVTDGNGEADIEYTAGSDTGRVEIGCIYRHKTPFGSDEVFYGALYLTVKTKTKPEFWEVKAQCTCHVSSTADTGYTNSAMGITITHSYSYEYNSSSSCQLTAIVRNMADPAYADTGAFWFDPDAAYAGDFKLAFVSGSFTSQSRSRTYDAMQAGGASTSGEDVISTEYSGSAAPKNGDLQISFFDGDNMADFGTACTGTETSAEYVTGNPPDNESTDDVSEAVDGGGSTADNTASFIKTDDGYLLSGGQTTITKSTDSPATTTTTATSFTISVTPMPGNNPDPTGVKSKADNRLPKTNSLFQNYPNPFNPTTMINYQLPMNNHVTLKVYDALGREVATLVNGRQNAGLYMVPFDGTRLSSGVYLYRIIIQGNDGKSFVSTKKLVLMK